MANQLTHALLAAAMTAALNPLIGFEPISWNVFLAAIIAMMLNLDSGESNVAKGSPFCSSLGGCTFFIYLAGLGAFFLSLLSGTPVNTMVPALLGVGCGAVAHVTGEYVTGNTIFTFPRKANPASWLMRADSSSDRLWSAWGRASLGNKHLEDVHLNAFSIGAVLACIALA